MTTIDVIPGNLPGCEEAEELQKKTNDASSVVKVRSI
jgi:hypothetical protein